MQDALVGPPLATWRYSYVTHLCGKGSPNRTRETLNPIPYPAEILLSPASSLPGTCCLRAMQSHHPQLPECRDNTQPLCFFRADIQRQHMKNALRRRILPREIRGGEKSIYRKHSPLSWEEREGGYAIGSKERVSQSVECPGLGRL